jgi:hypothetical protein
MKSLMLLNPRKKKRRSKRKVSARRTTRRRSTRRTTARRTTRRTTRRTARRTRRTSRRSSRAIRLKRGRSVTIMANPRRRSRRSSGGMRFGGNILSQVKGVFSKENLTVAAGGVGATVLTNFILSRTKADGSSLLPMPATNTAAAKIAYAVGIPVVGAILTRKFNPSLARGMVFGGLINGIVEAIKGYAPAETKKALGFAEYLEYTPMSAVGQTPGYSAINQFSTVRPMNSAFSNSSAFPADAWGR